MYYYKVDCWIPPRSGFDIVKKAEALKHIESIAEKLSEGSKEEFLTFLEDYKKETEGFILETFILESTEDLEDPDKIIRKEVLKAIPKVQAYSWDLIDCPVIKKPLR